MAAEVAIGSPVESAVQSIDRPNLNEPKWDQTSYGGRAKHFFAVTNPLNLLLTGSQLNEAKRLVTLYKEGKVPANVTNEELWQAKYRYDSAFHPDTGDKMILIGRMSAQVPMNMSITGCMMTWYQTAPAVLLWQWINQSFNAVVNFTNRSGDAPLPTSLIAKSYVLATSGAVITAMGLNHLAHHAPPLVGRFVPFAAVAAANCINIPMMRQRELTSGIPVFDADNNRLGDSKAAAKSAITQVAVSRIIMAMPGMIIPPIVMNKLEQQGYWKRHPRLAAPIQIGLVGFMLIFATPLCCALFPQKSSISTSKLEPEIKAVIEARGKSMDKVYFNKGL
ncbi:sideroflexin-1-like [Amphiura filiformis]|uniref:sideroflexin-1-like n=1 Tax=Amphiura filiformis TaxID=82378 RepID=UPI003B228723